MISKMKPVKDGGSRIGIVFNGSPLFTWAQVERQPQFVAPLKNCDFELKNGSGFGPGFNQILMSGCKMASEEPKGVNVYFVIG